MSHWDLAPPDSLLADSLADLIGETHEHAVAHGYAVVKGRTKRNEKMTMSGRHECAVIGVAKKERTANHIIFE